MESNDRHIDSSCYWHEHLHLDRKEKFERIEWGEWKPERNKK